MEIMPAGRFAERIPNNQAPAPRPPILGESASSAASRTGAGWYALCWRMGQTDGGSKSRSDPGTGVRRAAGQRALALELVVQWAVDTNANDRPARTLA